MSQWYFIQPGQSERLGPFDADQAFAYVRQHPAALCWRQGLSGWQPARAMPEFAEAFESGLPQDMPPIPLPEQLARMQSDDIDYGSRQEGGLMNKLLSAGRRIVTGESLFTTVFTHQGRGKARVAFAAPYPGTVLPLRLAEHGGCIICQKDSFLAGARGVRLGVFLQKRILTGLFGGEGFIMQKIEGDGWVFVHAGGTLVERDLAAGERIDVDTGCVVAFHPGVSMDVRAAGGIKSMLFAGEGMFLATLTGPGKVWLQSLPFSRMAGRMLAAAPQTGGKDVGEGSVLGGLGRLLDGDNGF